jgi:hypothetical protein
MAFTDNLSGATAFNSNIKKQTKALEINSQIAENNLINEK